MTTGCVEMKKVLLSHDGKMKMYLVPDDVADNLQKLGHLNESDEFQIVAQAATDSCLQNAVFCGKI